VHDHPVRLVLTDDLRRSRLTVFFRLLLAIPLVLWIWIWTPFVVLFAFLGWLIAIVTGRLPASLHEFFADYVHAVTQLAAYLAVAANPYPSFTGKPGYPVDVEIPGVARQSRWRIAVRLLLAIPALLLAGTLASGIPDGGVRVVAICGFLGWFASIALGRMPVGLRNLSAYGIGYAAQTYAYALLLTDRYPNADPEALGPAWGLSPHPVRLELADDGRRSRVTVFFRLFLALPHLVWLTLWSIAALLAAFANGVIALFGGRSAVALHRFLAAYVRYTAHVTAFLFLVAGPFPGFVGAPGYPVDVVVDAPERQNRWVTLFRIFLAIPALLLAGALSGVVFLVGFLGWFAALATGRMPTGLRNLGAVCVRYLAQANAYWFVVTDAYPNASPALRPPPAPEWEPLPFEAAI
jgi:hypothetical protein